MPTILRNGRTYYRIHTERHDADPEQPLRVEVVHNDPAVRQLLLHDVGAEPTPDARALLEQVLIDFSGDVDTLSVLADALDDCEWQNKPISFAPLATRPRRTHVRFDDQNLDPVVWGIGTGWPHYDPVFAQKLLSGCSNREPLNNKYLLSISDFLAAIETDVLLAEWDEHETGPGNRWRPYLQVVECGRHHAICIDKTTPRCVLPRICEDLSRFLANMATWYLAEGVGHPHWERSQRDRILILPYPVVVPEPHKDWLSRFTEGDLNGVQNELVDGWDQHGRIVATVYQPPNSDLPNDWPTEVLFAVRSGYPADERDAATQNEPDAVFFQTPERWIPDWARLAARALANQECVGVYSATFHRGTLVVFKLDDAALQPPENVPELPAPPPAPALPGQDWQHLAHHVVQQANPDDRIQSYTWGDTWFTWRLTDTGEVRMTAQGGLHIVPDGGRPQAVTIGTVSRTLAALAMNGQVTDLEISSTPQVGVVSAVVDLVMHAFGHANPLMQVQRADWPNPDRVVLCVADGQDD